MKRSVHNNDDDDDDDEDDECHVCYGVSYLNNEMAKNGLNPICYGLLLGKLQPREVYDKEKAEDDDDDDFVPLLERMTAPDNVKVDNLNLKVKLASYIFGCTHTIRRNDKLLDVRVRGYEFMLEIRNLVSENNGNAAIKPPFPLPLQKQQLKQKDQSLTPKQKPVYANKSKEESGWDAAVKLASFVVETEIRGFKTVFTTAWRGFKVVGKTISDIINGK